MTIIDNESGTAMPEETKQGIVAMNAVAAGLEALKAKHTSVPDCTTDEGYAEAKALAKSVARVRIDTEKAHKGAKAFFLEGGRNIDSMKNSILAVTNPIEDGYKSAIKAVDDEKARIAQEAAEKEQKRIDEIGERIDRIKAAPSNAVTLEQVDTALSKLDDIDLKSFDEFDEGADEHITEARKALTEKRVNLQAQADEAARLEEQRKEQEAAAAKLKAEQDEIERQKRELKEAQEAESRRAAIKDAEQKAAAKAEREKKEAAEQAERDKAAAVEAERLRVLEAEKAKAEAEKARIAKEAAEAERLAALAPDAEKLQAWLDSVPTLPEMDTDEGKDAAKTIGKRIAEIMGVVGRINQSEAA